MTHVIDNPYARQAERGLVMVERRQAWRLDASWFDLAFVAILVASGFIYLGNPHAWAPNVYIGNAQWGDADFWWQGALQLARGMVWDNINITYRMGYAVFAGLIAAVVGPHYELFHAVLRLVYLALASTTYVALRQSVGRPTAMAMVATLVFSPMQAEWLAISTSDGLGMMLNIAALVALIVAAKVRAGLLFVVLAGLFLSLAGLTRPLMTLFIAPAALLVLISTEGRMRKVVAVTALLCAFATPTLSWMSALYAKTGNFALAGSDASIFYAASTQRYQVWTPDMYPAVVESAQRKYGAPPTAKQQNDEFWREAVQNYRKEWRYHLHRLGWNVEQAADFSHARILPGDHVEEWLRIVSRGGLGLVLILGALAARRPVAACAVLLATALSLWPPASPWVVLACAACFLATRGSGASRSVRRIIACYWLTGAVAMFLIGGISELGGTAPAINALGYRLGLQFFFCNDWLVLLGLNALAALDTFRVPQSLVGWLTAPQALPGRLLKGAGALALGSLALVLCTGGVIAGWRGLKLAHAARVPAPLLEPLVEAFCKSQEAGPARADPAIATPATMRDGAWSGTDPASRPEGVRIFTGAIGGLMWQLEGQDRTRAMFHIQPSFRPFVIGPERTDVEFEQTLDENGWRNRQGAFFLRSFREETSHQGIYRESVPQVQLFVPLTQDDQAFDLTRAERFPVVRYAAALSSKLRFSGGTLEWWGYPIADVRRWFVLLPPEDSQPVRDVGIDVDMSDSEGKGQLSFAFRVEPLPAYVPKGSHVEVTVDVTDADRQTHQVLARDTASRGSPNDGTPAEIVEADLPERTQSVRITFAGIAAQEYVRVVELKLRSDDVTPTLPQQLCQGSTKPAL